MLKNLLKFLMYALFVAVMMYGMEYTFSMMYIVKNGVEHCTYPCTCHWLYWVFRTIVFLICLILCHWITFSYKKMEK